MFVQISIFIDVSKINGISVSSLHLLNTITLDIDWNIILWIFISRCVYFLYFAFLSYLERSYLVTK